MKKPKVLIVGAGIAGPALAPSRTTPLAIFTFRAARSTPHDRKNLALRKQMVADAVRVPPWSRGRSHEPDRPSRSRQPVGRKRLNICVRAMRVLPTM